MSKFPALSGKAIIDVLKKKGFAVKRQKDSHVFLTHPDGRATVVPFIAARQSGHSFFAKILRDTELTRNDFVKARKK